MDLDRFTVEGEKEKIASLKLQKARLIRLRWFYVSLLTIVAVSSSLIAGQSWETARGYLLIGAFVLFINAALSLVNRKLTLNLKTTETFLVLQLLLDLSVAAFITYDQGGLDARTTVLFALPIVAAGLLFSRGIVYLTAAIASIGYVLSIFLVSAKSGQVPSVAEGLTPIIFYPAFFLVLARVVTYLMEINISKTREDAYDAFLALLSHQLKHPASTARAIIDQLEHTGMKNLTKENQKYVSMLKGENQNLLRLLDNLLVTVGSSGVAAKTSNVDLAPLLKRIARQTAESHQRSDDIEFMMPEAPITATTDGEKLSIAVLNILDNAFEYSPEGTPVELAVKKSAGHIDIIIKDQGPGISKAAAASLFNKYSVATDTSVSKGVQGLGLGLFVAKKIVDAIGESLRFDSSKSGTEVIITIKGGQE